MSFEKDVADITASIDRRDAALVELDARNKTLTAALRGAVAFIKNMPVGGHMVQCCERILDGGEWTANG